MAKKSAREKEVFRYLEQRQKAIQAKIAAEHEIINCDEWISKLSAISDELYEQKFVTPMKNFTL